MYFCPKCNYTFDISKNLSSSDNRKTIKNVIDVFKLIKNKEDLSNYIASGDFTIDDVKNSKYYQKISSQTQKTIEQIFESITSGISFHCNNCNYKDVIKKSIQLYKIDLNSEVAETKSKEDNKLISKNPILPRTKDYMCKNINCITHKDDTNKEAVFYKANNSYNVTYVCSICYNSWE